VVEEAGRGSSIVKCKRMEISGKHAQAATWGFINGKSFGRGAGTGDEKWFGKLWGEGGKRDPPGRWG